jgi:hypothetical protein
LSYGLSRSGSVIALEIGSISLTQSTGIGSTNWLAAIDIRARAFVDHAKRNPGAKKGTMGSKS